MTTSLAMNAGPLVTDVDSLDVVLFGVGDLRVHDHQGLQQALQNVETYNSQILPLLILDDVTLSSIPGVVAHTVDTAAIITEIIQDLRQNLKERYNLNLHVRFGTPQGLSDVLVQEILELPAAEFATRNTTIRIHACDLGDADNVMGYGAFANLNNLPNYVQVCAWSCRLREDAWNSVETIPTSYPDYCANYHSQKPSMPLPTNLATVPDSSCIQIEGLTKLPSVDDMIHRIAMICQLDPKRCTQEHNTGLFETHWGGLDSITAVESEVLKSLKRFVEECNEDDEEYAKLPLECVRNIWSLEHATMAWNLRGDGTKDTMNPKNLIAGERLTRYLAAPLFFGTLSPRQLWYTVKAEYPFFSNPFRLLVEGREWHSLLAARNIRTDPAYQGKGDVRYAYWRWHGFLCRYAKSILNEPKEGEKEGLLLVHGFGASCGQWSKLMRAVSDVIDVNSNMEALAPDLLGFGQSEKPGITYAGYTWECQIGDFVKEIAIAKNGWSSFVIGGNSIGGFTSMCAAANDATTRKVLSAAGAPGTGRCTGAILMNPAGVIQSQEYVSKMEESSGTNVLLESVAQVTAEDMLLPCKYV